MAMAATLVVEPRSRSTRPWLVGGVLLALLAAELRLPGRAAGLRQPGRRVGCSTRVADVQPDLLRRPAVRLQPQADAGHPGRDFGANLLGAMVGGVAEYLSLITGFQMLLIVVAGCYLAALAARPRT